MQMWLQFKTIHSFLRIKPYIDYAIGKEIYKPDYNAPEDKTDILIVDESSMISEELFGYITESLIYETTKVVLFIGDPYISTSSNR